MRKFFIILTILLLCCGFTVSAQNEAQSVLTGNTGDFSSWIGSENFVSRINRDAEWYVLGASRLGTEAGQAAPALLEALSSDRCNRVQKLKMALVLLSLGADPADDRLVTALSDNMGKQGIMSWIFGLHLMHNGVESPIDAIGELLSRRCADGGWALSPSGASDVDITAMALQALAPYQADSAVSAATEEAMTLLSTRQTETGGFLSYGVENAESSAQVILALCSLGISIDDVRFVKNGYTALDALNSYRIGTGWRHVSDGDVNANATVQAFLALTALELAQDGRTLYSFDRITPIALPTPAPTEAPSSVGSYKLPAVLGVAGLALAMLLVLLLTRRLNKNNILATGLIAAALIAFLLLTTFSSPDSYYTPVVKDGIGHVTIEIRCDTVAGTEDKYIPSDGTVLGKTEFVLGEGDTVRDILVEAAKKYTLSLDAERNYVRGIQYLYELDERFGDLSGWIYTVNGLCPSVGCGSYLLHDGDAIVWHYTLTQGNDIGGAIG